MLYPISSPHRQQDQQTAAALSQDAQAIRTHQSTSSPGQYSHRSRAADLYSFRLVFRRHCLMFEELAQRIKCAIQKVNRLQLSSGFDSAGGHCSGKLKLEEV